MSLLATDTLYHFGGRLAQFSRPAAGAGKADRAQRPLSPVDLGDQADVKAYQQTLDLLLADPGVDGVLVIKDTQRAQRRHGGGRRADSAPARSALLRHRQFSRPNHRAGSAATSAGRRVPTYETASGAVRAFMRIVQYKRNQSLLMETPPSLPEEFTADVAAARALIADSLASGRRYLNEYEAMQLLAAYCIPVAETRFADSPAAAAAAAADLSQPVALKIMSPDIGAKSQIGGVVRYLNTPEAVSQAAAAMLAQLHSVAPAAKFDGFALQPIIPRGAYEIALGVRSGERFGPVICFGQGGTEAEIINDMAYGLPPLNMHLAREIMAQTRLYQRLRYSLLRRADLNAVALTLVKVSQMVIDLGELVELDINPLRLNARGVVALDARVQLTPRRRPPSGDSPLPEGV